jgi:N-dimethylarginine dimethylaminohydrolase
MTPDDARRTIAEAAPRARPRRVLLCRPDGYRIAYAINPHMRNSSGELNVADGARARAQWEALAEAYRAAGSEVDVIAGDPAFPDMVFAANQTLPYTTADGRKAVLLSNMHSPERRGEVAKFEDWFKSRGWEIRRLSREEAGSFEGCGDLLPHPARRVFFGGYGFRTTARALDLIARTTGWPVIPLRLVDARFYHLDTCLAPLGGGRALAFRPAFDAASWDVLGACFDRILEPPAAEAVQGLACNVDCPDGKRVLIDSSCEETARMLAAEGFEVVRLDTSELLKAGGSVFCMKQTLP